jgi:hypothetical protein
MRLALYRLIRMAIEMVREAAARFSVLDLLSCITVLVIGHGIVGEDIPIMARLAKARRWSKR